MSPTITIHPDDIVDNRYRVERVLGIGGMGVVVAAIHVDLDERRALKLMHAELRNNPDLVERFLREARAAVRLKSPHVARVLDVARLASGEPYIVMEYLDGVDLSRLLKTKKKVSPQEAVSFVMQASEAIVEAHGAGIVHRDLKPGNLFLTQEPEGHVKVLDFGISKVTNAPGSARAEDLTGTTEVIGSPLYMAPEQIRSLREVDGRVDIWALGVILYELSTGIRPFHGPSMADICSNVLIREPDPPSSLTPGIPPALDALVAHCLKKDREQRLGDVRELLTSLKAIERSWSGLGGGPDATTAPVAARTVVPHVHLEPTQVIPPGSGGAPDPLAPKPAPGPWRGATPDSSPNVIRPEAAVPPSSLPAPEPLVATATAATAAPDVPTSAKDVTTGNIWGTVKTGPVLSPQKPSRAGLIGGIVALSGLLLAGGSYLLLRGEAPAPTPTTAASGVDVPVPPPSVEPAAQASAAEPPALAPSAPPAASESAAPTTQTVPPPPPPKVTATVRPKPPPAPSPAGPKPPSPATPKPAKPAATGDAFGRQRE